LPGRVQLVFEQAREVLACDCISFAGPRSPPLGRETYPEEH
jgi:hypothetical protein